MLPSRRTALAVAGLAALGATTLAAPAQAATKPDTACMRNGIATLKSVGLFSAVAKGGLPIATAVEYGVAPREGTDVTSLPDPLPLSVVLADHRAGENSLFDYPWC
ncbi:hypothetical protein [Nocardioides marmoribigeumensis]|jgi:hypothetical protein|uniref:ABC-type nitrate/sulfonate/bicarbonate transport system substrate-binding protein n=1 Tax=Nocardioides marmoribigeumensis TaxID=433649 RepID=A0ABU2C1I4_9ACTN|nr:hypothetical protein [Nocardioides marmoribigeumensis]MDR7364528.1 ABC-type nitrate/sulfonate/bicarbonate transport system substrate-binding protein [Nocardioides marmoribigeumensis]